MTQEEKAKEIGMRYTTNALMLMREKDVEEALLEMAKWKDEQLVKCFERLKEEYLQSGSFDVDEFTAKLATLQRIEEEMKISKI